MFDQIFRNSYMTYFFARTISKIAQLLLNISINIHLHQYIFPQRERSKQLVQNFYPSLATLHINPLWKYLILITCSDAKINITRLTLQQSI